MRTLVLASCLLFACVAPARADKISLLAHNGEGRKDDLVQPFGVAFDRLGGVWIVEMKGERLRAVSPAGYLMTFAGSGKAGNDGDGGVPQKATFSGMHSLAMSADERRVYLADTMNNRVRVYDSPKFTVEAFAGTGEKGFSGDGGKAKDAKFGGVYCVGFDPDQKNLYVTDLDNRRIRKIDMKTEIVTTVAGNGEKGVPKDGEDALKQPLVDPRAHAVDKDGNIWILERGGHCLRVVDAKGKVRTVAGTGKAGQGSGKALEAALNGPKHLCIDKDGSVLIADTENHRVVRYDPKADTIAVVAGTGKKGAGLGGGDPRKAELNQPHGVSVHPKTGDLYIADSSNNRVLKVVREP